ncbi:MAG: type VI secretion system-associated protein TagO, partial [Pseudomonadota bacterium]
MRRFIAGIAAMTAATVATALLIGQTSPSGEARPATPECEGVKFGLSDAEIAAMETRDLGNWIERAKECRAAMAGAGEGEAQAPASMAVAEANTAALAKCTEIASSVDRLACFDRAAKGEGLAGEVKVEHPRGRWRVSTDINKFTDREDVYASVDAKDEIRARSYRTSRPTLFIRCKDNTTSIIIAFGAYITTDTARLRLRIGDGKPVTANWRMSTN